MEYIIKDVYINKEKKERDKKILEIIIEEIKKHKDNK